MTPGALAALLTLAGGSLFLLAALLPAVREAAIVVGIFCLCLAGGVLNWDRRGGH